MLGQIGWHECQVDRENDGAHKLFQLSPVHDHELILRCSPLARACHATFGYIDEHGKIGLTKSKAFNRKFLHWAAEAFKWPGQTHDDLFYLNKVLNEFDFPACELLHQLLLLQKLGRHYKGQFRLTASGKKMAGDPSAIFETLVPFYLFQIVHEHGRFDVEPPFGNWDIFLNVLNVELQTGANGREITTLFYGENDPVTSFRDDDFWSLYIHILRPLCWAGLLQEASVDTFPKPDERVYLKTELWDAALDLETDEQVVPIQRH